MEDNNNNAKTKFKSELNEIKLEFHKFAKEKAKVYGHNSLHLECFPPEYNKEWIKFMQETAKKIDVMLGKVPSDDKLRLNLILIKVFCVIRSMLGLKVTNQKKFIRVAESLLVKCEKELKPFKNKTEGVWLYVMNQVVHVQLINIRNDAMNESDECRNDFRKGLALIEDADKHYTDFIHYRMEKPWGIDEIFLCHDKEGKPLKSGLADDFYKFREFTMKMLLMELSIKADDEPKVRKYGIEGLRTFMQCPQHHENVHSLVRFAIGVAQPFTNVHMFVQSQHIIAVMMHIVVEFRRSLAEDQRNTVNPIQYDASYMYAELGNRLIRKSHEVSRDKYFREHGLPFESGCRDIHNDNCERLLPKSPMLNQYEKVFPTKLTLDPDTYKKMQKKTGQWIARMDELKKNNTAPPNLCLKPLHWIQERKGTLLIATLCDLFEA